jgi:hypothetical protein
VNDFSVARTAKEHKCSLSIFAGFDYVSADSWTEQYDLIQCSPFIFIFIFISGSLAGLLPIGPVLTRKTLGQLVLG